MTPSLIPAEVFSTELLPDEKIVWTGQPNRSVVFHPEDWFVIPFSLMWGGFTIFGFLSGPGTWQFRWFITPFVLIGQYIIWGRFLFQYWNKGRTFYALTNRRALTVSYGFRSRLAEDAFFTTLPMIGKIVRPDGIGSISFGGPFMGEWRPKGSPPRPLTFDDIDGADFVYQLVNRLRSQLQEAD